MDIDKDFNRNVWCLLGLPFDALTLGQAAQEIVKAAETRQRCFLSTPNTNFLCAAQNDPDFRESVINSDLSVADGFFIVQIAKWLRIPISERVAGSDLIDVLYQRQTDKPLKIFFFGGEPGVGAKASEMVNAKASGLLAAGHFAPGFGSVKEMSAPDIINNINNHDIDFLIVSLGAKKGQAWIEDNKALLKAPIISHLGAVINFFAGTVIRAPESLQRLGMEWLWRIYQEPKLWHRYYRDGIDFLKLLATCIIPYALWLRLNSRAHAEDAVTVSLAEASNEVKRLSLDGPCTASTLHLIKPAFKMAAAENMDVIIDLGKVTHVDAAFLGLCLIVKKYVNASGRSLRLINAKTGVNRVIRWLKADYLLK